MTALGIDLGTTYSVVATLDAAGRPVVLPNALGELTTPSVVCFQSPDSVLVGTAARNAAPVFPEQTVALVKRQMGTDRGYRFHGRDYLPESVSALILRALVPNAGPEPVPVVVTVPAYFGIREREATQQACLLAGLRPLELISEPAAAAVHYGFSDSVGLGTALVYDLGGGTFDATVLRLGSRIEVVATDGDTELGGADWDRRLLGHLLDRFMEQARPDGDPADDEAFAAELALTAERVKRELSVTTTQRVPLRYAGCATTVAVTRAAFEDMTRDLVDRTVDCVRRLLDAARRAGVDRVDHCLLVGGSSRMPMVADRLAAEFGWAPRLHDPDLAVAKGAALRAYQLLPRAVSALAPADREQVTSVVPRGFGLLIRDSDDPEGRREYVDHVIHQNDRLPVVARETTVSTILPGQGSARIEVYEQAGAVESAEPADNRRVLDGELSGLPPGLPAGSPIRVRLSLGLDGRLSLTATEPAGGATLELEACIEGVLDGAGRAEAARAIAKLTVRQ